MKNSMALMLVTILVTGEVCCNNTTGSVTQPDCEIPKCLISYLQIQVASLQSLKSDLETAKKQLQIQATSLQSVKSDLETTKRQLQIQATSLQSVKSDLETTKRQLQIQATSLQSVKSDLETSKNQLQRAMSGQWPPGRYCILASGVCPAGFTRSNSYLRALRLYSSSISYIKPAKFGDSMIKCHGRCGQYGPYGDLHIVACCK